MIKKQYTQVARTGDPTVDLVLSKALYDQLMQQSKYNARDLKGEIIARVTQMMHYQAKQFEATQTANAILSRLQAA